MNRKFIKIPHEIHSQFGYLELINIYDNQVIWRTNDLDVAVVYKIKSNEWFTVELEKQAKGETNA